MLGLVVGTPVPKASSASLTMIPCLFLFVSQTFLLGYSVSFYFLSKEYLQLPNHSRLRSVNTPGIPGSGRQVGPDSQVLQGGSSLCAFRREIILLHLTKFKYLTPESKGNKQQKIISNEKQ